MGLWLSKSEVYIMLKCKKCGGKVIQKGAIMSGNSKYAIWKCEKCDHEAMECIGVKDY
jgi:hypothetical protein